MSSPFNPAAPPPTLGAGNTGTGLHDDGRTGAGLGWFGQQSNRDELAHHRQMQLRADDQYREDTALDRSFDAMRRNGLNPLAMSAQQGGSPLAGVGQSQGSQGTQPTGNGQGQAGILSLLAGITGIVGKGMVSKKIAPTVNAIANKTNRTFVDAPAKPKYLDKTQTIWDKETGTRSKHKSKLRYDSAIGGYMHD